MKDHPAKGTPQYRQARRDVGPALAFCAGSSHGRYHQGAHWESPVHYCERAVPLLLRMNGDTMTATAAKRILRDAFQCSRRHYRACAQGGCEEVWGREVRSRQAREMGFRRIL